MRMLLRVSIPVDTGNAAARAGTLGSTIEQILADLKPEAAYFFADDSGQRSGSIVLDMKDASQIPANAEKVSFQLAIAELRGVPGTDGAVMHLPGPWIFNFELPVSR